MPLTNAERQRRYRERIKARLAKAEKAQKTKTKPDERLAQKLGPILDGLYAEGRKNMATMSPPTVLTLAVQLERALLECGLLTIPARRARKCKVCGGKITAVWPVSLPAGGFRHPACRVT